MNKRLLVLSSLLISSMIGDRYITANDPDPKSSIESFFRKYEVTDSKMLTALAQTPQLPNKGESLQSPTLPGW